MSNKYFISRFNTLLVYVIEFWDHAIKFVWLWKRQTGNSIRTRLYGEATVQTIIWKRKYQTDQFFTPRAWRRFILYFLAVKHNCAFTEGCIIMSITVYPPLQTFWTLKIHVQWIQFLSSFMRALVTICMWMEIHHLF